MGGFLVEVHPEAGGGLHQSDAGGRVREPAELPVLKEPIGVGLRLHEAHLEVGEPRAHHGDRQGVPADGLEGHAYRGEGGGIEVVHLVDEEQSTASRRGSSLSDLAEQVDKVLFGIARVGHPRDGFHIQFQLDPSGSEHTECLDHAKSSLDSVPDAVLAAHLAKQPRGHLGEGGPEVGL